MTEETFEEATLMIADSAFVSEMAYLVGDATVGERASLWPFTCLRSDQGPVVVGQKTNVKEFSMLHGATSGDRVTAGHGAVVDFATIADDSLVGNEQRHHGWGDS